MTFNNEVTVTINGEVVENIAPGLPTIGVLDETMDSGTLIIAPTKKKERYPVFSEATVTTVSNSVTEKKYFYASEDGVDTVCKDPVLYSHTTQLIEPTKRLESFPCDNLTFTLPPQQSSYPTTLVNGKLTLYDVVMRIRECAQVRRRTDDRIYPFDVPADTEAILRSVPVRSQFFINAGNVRDALNQVFKIINATVRLRDFTNITVDFFNKRRNLISLNDSLEFSESQSVENFCTEVRSVIVNAACNEDDSQNDISYPSVGNVDYVGNMVSVRASDGGRITTDNMVFKLPRPIYALKYVRIQGTFSSDATGVPGGEFSIPLFSIKSDGTPENNNLIVEKSVYEALEYKTTFTKIRKNKYRILTLGKDMALVYDYLGNKIYGMGESFKADWLFSQTVINSIIKWNEAEGATDEMGLPTESVGRYTLTNFQDLRAEIVYTTTSSPLAVVRKRNPEPTKYMHSITVNQAANLLDVTAYGANLKGVADRLGRPERICPQIYRYASDVPKIGDYTADGYIVTQVQRSLFNDYVVAVLGLTKDFNRRSQFIDVDSEVRQFVIPAAGKSLERHMHYDETIIISQNDVVSDTGCFIDDLGFSLLVSGLRSFESATGVNTQIPCIAAMNAEYNTPSEASYVINSVQSNAIANSIALTFGFDDNRSAGNQSTRDGDTGDRVVEKAIRYTDTNGALKEMHVLFAAQVNDPRPNTSLSNAQIANNLPLYLAPLGEPNFINASFDTYQSPFNVYKDPAEILKMTYQIHVEPDTSFSGNFYVKQGFALENLLVVYPRSSRGEAPVKRTINVYAVPPSEKYEEYEEMVRGQVIGEITQESINITGTTATLTLPFIPPDYSWCIGNALTGNMYMSYNPAIGEPPITGLSFGCLQH